MLTVDHLVAAAVAAGLTVVVAVDGQMVEAAVAGEMAGIKQTDREKGRERVEEIKRKMYNT